MRAKRFLAILLCCLLIGNIFPSRVSAAEGTAVDTETPAEAEKAVPAQESGTGQTGDPGCRRAGNRGRG